MVACGAECGIVTAGLAAAANRHWGVVTGAPAIETSIVRSGSRSLKFVAAATRPYMSKNGVASQTVCYGRVYFRTSSAAPSADMTIVYVDSGTSASSAYFRIKTNGVFDASFNSGTGAVNGPTIVADTWYGLEFESNVAANPNTIKWRTWSADTGWVTQTAVSVAQAAATISTAGPTIGLVGGPTSDVTVYMDDVVLAVGTSASEYWSDVVAKPGRVLRYLPSADGAHSAFTTGDFKYNNSTNIANTATDVYTYLDDADQTSIADGYISQNVAGAGKYIRVAFADEAAYGKPRFVAVTSTHHSASTSANEMHLRVSDNGSNWTNVWGNWAAAGLDTSDTTAHFLHKVLTAKPSGGSWTTPAINAMEAEWGNSDDVSPVPYIDSVSLEVDWLDQSFVPLPPRLTTPRHLVRR